MKNAILFVCTLFLLKGQINAQTTIPQRVQVILGADTIAPVKNGSVKPVTIKLKFQLSGVFDKVTAAKNEVTLAVQKGALSINPSFATNNIAVGGVNTTIISIPEINWPLSGVPVEIVKEIQLLIPGGNDISEDEIGQIIIDGHPESFHSLVLSNDAETINTKYKPNKPFWIEVGANFDLLDGLQINNPFFGVFFHKRDVRPLGKNAGSLTDNGQKNVGIFAGVFESKTISTNQTEDFFSRSYFNR
jgi:hypothetical protein